MQPPDSYTGRDSQPQGRHKVTRVGIFLRSDTAALSAVSKEEATDLPKLYKRTRTSTEYPASTPQHSDTYADLAMCPTHPSIWCWCANTVRKALRMKLHNRYISHRRNEGKQCLQGDRRLQDQALAMAIANGFLD
ncbi:hypothetical protein MRX96_015259 [Rhipicephalus microplus]